MLKRIFVTSCLLASTLKAGVVSNPLISMEKDDQIGRLTDKFYCAKAVHSWHGVLSVKKLTGLPDQKPVCLFIGTNTEIFNVQLIPKQLDPDLMHNDVFFAPTSNYIAEKHYIVVDGKTIGFRMHDPYFVDIVFFYAFNLEQYRNIYKGAMDTTITVAETLLTPTELNSCEDIEVKLMYAEQKYKQINDLYLAQPLECDQFNMLVKDLQDAQLENERLKKRIYDLEAGNDVHTGNDDIGGDDDDFLHSGHELDLSNISH